MYELIQLASKTFYIDCPTKIGIYLIDESNVCLIDSGNNKDTAKKICKILAERQWNLQCIINTHSHADHIGGNNYLQERFACPIYAFGVDRAFVENPFFEPSFLFGAYPPKALQNKFLLAEASKITDLKPDLLPKGLELLSIDGHAHSMIGLKTSDNVCFLADVLMSEATIKKYHITYTYNVEEYLKSLELITKLEADIFVFSHAETTSNFQELLDINRNKVLEILNLLQNICQEALSFEDILQKVFTHYDLQMDFNQHALVGSTIRSYLAYLNNQNIIKYEFINNKLLWIFVK